MRTRSPAGGDAQSRRAGNENPISGPATTAAVAPWSHQCRGHRLTALAAARANAGARNSQRGRNSSRVTAQYESPARRISTRTARTAAAYAHDAASSQRPRAGPAGRGGRDRPHTGQEAGRGASGFRGRHARHPQNRSTVAARRLLAMLTPVVQCGPSERPAGLERPSR